MYAKNHLTLLIGLMLIFTALAKAQQINSYDERMKQLDNSELSGYPTRNVGPVVQGGRITDIEVHEDYPGEYYAATASGGLWRSTDYGISFEPIFDNVGALGIGDMAIAPSNADVIYVGTGEHNSSRSSYAGTGVYKSTDHGKTWSAIGLENTHHIGKVVVHPDNENVVWVASIGSLYSTNTDRGVYKSEDGGETWTKTLFINDSTGVIDLIINPENPDQLWAASWQRIRTASNFTGSGIGSAIYRSNDGGKTWRKTMEGMPQSAEVGRIGLTISPANTSVIYAYVDSQVPNEPEPSEGLSASDLEKMDSTAFQQLEDGKLNRFLRSNDFPGKYSAASVKKDVADGKYTIKDIVEYVGDANSRLLSDGVVGAEVYRSDDQGDTWKKMNSYDLEGVYSTYGYYFGKIEVAPNNEDLIYILGVPLLKSTDGGLTYSRLDSTRTVHVDHQDIWVDPSNSKHVLLANDGGLYESYDEGANWRHLNSLPIGQFYTVSVDEADPYNIYGGLQDNGTFMGSSTSVPNRTAKWDRVSGGDGMFVTPHPTEPGLVYSGFQFGYYAKTNRFTGEQKYIRPSSDIGDPKLRFNWRTPLKLSKHNPDIVYLGTQFIHRSMDGGDNWTKISPDLTKNKPQGNVPYSTITTFDESIHEFGHLLVGTDDGNLYRTDGGEWTKLNGPWPDEKWIASAVISSHDPSTYFVTLNGYREDDFNTYVYKSNDQGKSWVSLKANLPEVTVNELIQDHTNPHLLFLGTDHGLYTSLNGGERWELFSNIPNVSVYDLVVHPRESDLVVATHGRSLYVVNIEDMRTVAGNTTDQLLSLDTISYSANWGKARRPYLEPRKVGSNITYYLNSAKEFSVELRNENDRILRTWKVNGKEGFNYLMWDYKVHEPVRRLKEEELSLDYISKGTYELIFTGPEGSSLKTSVIVK